MIRTVMAEADVVKNVRTVLARINAATEKTASEYKTRQPRLVAVSKTKPKELVIAAYKSGQRHFGENYVQELVDKGNDPEICNQCPEISWHLIGHLQRNKVNKVVSTPGLFVIETVDSEKLATALDNAWKKLSKDTKLRVMVQVNTSGEEAKEGCAPGETIKLVKYILECCKSLEFMGLMTIGIYGYDTSLGPNPDFICLQNLRTEVSKALGLKCEEIELSMGMTDDFEQAVELGSTNVRVGRLIFGERQMKSSQTAKEVAEGVEKLNIDK